MLARTGTRPVAGTAASRGRFQSSTGGLRVLRATRRVDDRRWTDPLGSACSTWKARSAGTHSLRMNVREDTSAWAAATDRSARARSAAGSRAVTRRRGKGLGQPALDTRPLVGQLPMSARASLRRSLATTCRRRPQGRRPGRRSASEQGAHSDSCCGAGRAGSRRGRRRRGGGDRQVRAPEKFGEFSAQFGDDPQVGSSSTNAMLARPRFASWWSFSRPSSGHRGCSASSASMERGSASLSVRSAHFRQQLGDQGLESVEG